MEMEPMSIKAIAAMTLAVLLGSSDFPPLAQVPCRPAGPADRRSKPLYFPF
jgi:hypothetical protein